MLIHLGTVKETTGKPHPPMKQPLNGRNVRVNPPGKNVFVFFFIVFLGMGSILLAPLVHQCRQKSR